MVNLPQRETLMVLSIFMTCRLEISKLALQVSPISTSNKCPVKDLPFNNQLILTINLLPTFFFFRPQFGSQIACIRPHLYIPYLRLSRPPLLRLRRRNPATTANLGRPRRLDHLNSNPPSEPGYFPDGKHGPLCQGLVHEEPQADQFSGSWLTRVGTCIFPNWRLLCSGNREWHYLTD